MKVNPVTAT